ncbi:probable E3 ubiquitin-protein ligase XERICO [Mercurialis annua]|uniref:probable E3 ubiquitin-protein ligase XERICO n=1 Tax=Mercurialis annua TaxID=3986 RepID=UPI00215F9EAD|nr:probable E3 ubiquitin-protein ligase XERICO [Mercurialis annua]
MGISSFPSGAEGVLPILVMNTLLTVAYFKNMVRSLAFVLMGANSWIQVEDYDQTNGFFQENVSQERRISITQFKSCCNNNNRVECCVCLCGFEEEEEISELSYCKHFFHRKCLDKWFDNYKHTTCPLCRSVL